MRREHSVDLLRALLFLANHITDLVAIDFFVVPTIDFKVLYVLVVLAHRRREVVYFNVTDHPTGVPPVPWTVKGLGFKLCIVGVAGSVLDISSSRS